MFEWLFGKKKKKNIHNYYRKVSLEASLAGKSRKDKVLLLRDLKGSYHYNPDNDFLYDAEDMTDELILFYLLMGMPGVAWDEEEGLYADVDATLGDIVDKAIEKAIIDEIPHIEEADIGSLGDTNIGSAGDAHNGSVFGNVNCSDDDRGNCYSDDCGGCG